MCNLKRPESRGLAPFVRRNIPRENCLRWPSPPHPSNHATMGSTIAGSRRRRRGRVAVTKVDTSGRPRPGHERHSRRQAIWRVAPLLPHMASSFRQAARIKPAVGPQLKEATRSCVLRRHECIRERPSCSRLQPARRGPLGRRPAAHILLNRAGRGDASGRARRCAIDRATPRLVSADPYQDDHLERGASAAPDRAPTSRRLGAAPREDH